jgi:hypothetical protein
VVSVTDPYGRILGFLDRSITYTEVPNRVRSVYCMILDKSHPEALFIEQNIRRCYEEIPWTFHDNEAARTCESCYCLKPYTSCSLPLARDGLSLDPIIQRIYFLCYLLTLWP